MKILYLHQHFKVNSGGTRSYEFSKYLTENSHEVTMITGNQFKDSEINGVNIKSTKTKYDNKMSFIRRIYSFVHYIFKSILLGLKEKNTDLIFATSTPLTIGIPALIISKIKRKKFVFEVRDVWPDVPIELGFIKSSIVKRLLYLLEKKIYENASHIIVLSEGMKQNLLKKGVEEKKITVITNLAINNYYNEIKKNKKNQYDDKLVCIHPGTMGYVNGLDFILDLADQYYNKDIIYLLIGEGNQKSRLKNRIKKENIKNVEIRDSLPKHDVARKIKNSDVGIMIVENYEILQDNSANKFFDFLAAGIPIVINYGGWQKEVIEKFKIGRGFDYEDKEGFYNYLLELKKNKKMRENLGLNAKKLAEIKYDSEKLSKKFEDVLRKTYEDH